MTYFTVRGKSEAAGAQKRALAEYGHNTCVGVTVRTVKTCGTSKIISNSNLTMSHREP